MIGLTEADHSVALLWSASRTVAPFVYRGASIAVGDRTAGDDDDDTDGVVVREAALAALSALVVTMMC
jgi:hypothetical protein